MIEMNEADSLSRDLQQAQLARVARRSAKILKIAAIALAAGAVVAGWIAATSDDYYGDGSEGMPMKLRIGQFLGTALWTLGWAALILAAAFAMEIVALRTARLPDPSAELSEFTQSSPDPVVAPTNFAARPAQAPAASSPPTMKIANDEIWRR